MYPALWSAAIADSKFILFSALVEDMLLTDWNGTLAGAG
jgi:hypothetical protein